MAQNVRYQIFVSSTYTDLFPIRRQVTEHILSMNHIPAGMEMFSASGRKQWATIQKAIDNSDYYILIIGERYGSISPEDGISYTEKEFNYAVSKNIPTLCFLPGENFSTKREHRDIEPELVEKLEAFKGRVKEQLCDFWDDGAELINKVSAALYKVFTEEPGTGWIRGNATDPEALTKLIHVMEENNRLTKRIQQLEEMNQVDLPVLSLLVNDHDVESGPMIYSLPEPEEIETFIPDLHQDNIPTHLLELITQASLEEYNSSKPSQERVDQHNEAMRFYQAAKTGKLTFKLKNVGPVKANNVSIRIFLSEGIHFADKKEIDEIDTPYLHFPLDIVTEAEEKYQDQFKDKKTDLFGSSSFLRRNIPNNIYRNILSHNQNYHITIKDDGSIYGDRKSVRQDTIELLTSEAYLLPEKRGRFLMSIQILCDEYREWQASSLEIIID
ncbi:uncharacterized protein DUF4062 [Pantoea sp. AG1095]|uniref:DUF4062 domain-containing protein n=1 Tax=Pantoea sp. AG1095 TaxID=2184004 RepID=UPI000D8F0E24|nr:DUF4062 domain-containing protein [Pantoea sp. AG1095]PYG48751.1 uncharacterized protein DUF4062 [Pantoea sp. AG1095]